MSLPTSLTGLSEREAIKDALYRVCSSFDTHDVAMFNSSWIGQDVTLELLGHATHGLEAIRTGVLDRIKHLDTLHTVTNVRIDVQPGASKASLTANAMNQHCPLDTGTDPKAPKYLTGCTYFLDLVKDESDGLWKIKTFKINVIWTQGDASVMIPSK